MLHSHPLTLPTSSILAHHSMLAQRDPDKIIDYFMSNFVCGLRANIAQVIFFTMLGKPDQDVSYNLVFLFNAGPEFFFCNDGEIWAMSGKFLQFFPAAFAATGFY